MVITDANLLIYAYDVASPFHQQAVRWLEETFASGDDFGLPVQAMFTFIRIGTNPVLPTRFTMEEALKIVDSWLVRPQVRLLAPGPGHWQIFRNLCVQTGATGKLATDTHLAALAIEHSAAFFSADRDFARFPGLRWHNPLAAD